MTHYETLGVTPEATDKEIKAAYRSLAQKLHPDKDEGSEEKFQELGHAYSILSDSKKRAAYDRGEPEQPRSGAATIESEAIRAILSCVDALVQQCDDVSINHLNLREALMRSINDGLRDNENNKKKAKRDFKKFKTMRSRIKKGEFIFAGWAKQQQHNALQTYKRHIFVGKVAKRMRELATELDYDFEPQLHQPATFFFGNATGFGGKI